MPSIRSVNIQILIAAAIVLLGVWAVAQRTWLGVVPAVLAGVLIGASSGRRTAAALAAQFQRRRRVVLYSEDTPLYATLLPLASLSFSPGMFLLMLYSAWVNPSLQIILPMLFCAVTTAWLTHEIIAARCLTELGEDGGPVAVHWFHARSVTGPEGMIGQEAVVEKDCRPDGYVRLNGERWRAHSLDGTPLGAGQRVIVEYLDGLVLTVARHPSVPEAPDH